MLFPSIGDGHSRRAGVSGLYRLLLLVLFLTTRQNAKANGQIDLSNWMAQTPVVRGLTVAQMAWPGTHDTGAYSYSELDYTTPTSSFAEYPWWQTYANTNFTDPAINGVSPDTSIDLFHNITIGHPGHPIYKQLVDGARYLDLRVARSSITTDKTYYIVHEWVVSNLSDALSDLLRFTEAHTGEVIMVKVQPKYNIATDAETMELMNYVESFSSDQGNSVRDFSFQKTAAGGQNYSQCGTIGDLLTSGKRIILTYQSISTDPTFPTIWFYWAQAFYTDHWRQAHTVSLKHQYLLGDILDKWVPANNGKVYNVQFILTPPAQDALWCSENFTEYSQGVQTSVGQPSLAVLAGEMNPSLNSFVFQQMNASVRTFTNIYTIDFNFEFKHEINAIMRKLIEERAQLFTQSGANLLSAPAFLLVHFCVLFVVHWLVSSHIELE